ncbi:acylphosphatase [Blastopirellula marina]|uniref:acylphosphatase n=1 Tax=Blastopirellula marina TaxID=124 RepID=A0A2S8GCS0_9BACT|nr:acylphosphatase [Blastopirellula marina]PQO42247.1 acylphosphatase [Blastopirellula marina]
MTDESTRMHVVFSGHVQGVGFRQTTVQIARSHPVTGWVKNLSNGNVELVAEGTKSACSEFLASIRQRMFEFVNDIDCQWTAPSNEFDHFEIHY